MTIHVLLQFDKYDSPRALEFHRCDASRTEENTRGDKVIINDKQSNSRNVRMI